MEGNRIWFMWHIHANIFYQMNDHPLDLRDTKNLFHRGFKKKERIVRKVKWEKKKRGKRGERERERERNKEERGAKGDGYKYR